MGIGCLSKDIVFFQIVIPTAATVGIINGNGVKPGGFPGRHPQIHTVEVICGITRDAGEGALYKQIISRSWISNYICIITSAETIPIPKES